MSRTRTRRKFSESILYREEEEEKETINWVRLLSDIRRGMTLSELTTTETVTKTTTGWSKLVMRTKMKSRGVGEVVDEERDDRR